MIKIRILGNLHFMKRFRRNANAYLYILMRDTGASVSYSLDEFSGAGHDWNPTLGKFWSVLPVGEDRRLVLFRYRVTPTPKVGVGKKEINTITVTLTNEGSGESDTDETQVEVIDETIIADLLRNLDDEPLLEDGIKAILESGVVSDERKY